MRDTKDHSLQSYASHVLVCSGAAIFADVFAYPFFAMRLLQQTDNLNLRDAFKTLYRQQKLYRGFSTCIGTALPASFLYLTAKDWALDIFGKNNTGYAMQGSFSTAGGMIIWTPATRLMTLKQREQKSALTLVKDIINNEGFRGLYRGAGPEFCASIYSNTLSFWMMAQILQHFPENQRQHLLPNCFATLLGFSVSAVLTTPLDVVTTHMKIQKTQAGNPRINAHSIMKTIYAQRGLKGFFAGASGRAAWLASYNLAVPFYDYAKNLAR